MNRNLMICLTVRNVILAGNNCSAHLSGMTALLNQNPNMNTNATDTITLDNTNNTNTMSVCFLWGAFKQDVRFPFIYLRG